MSQAGLAWLVRLLAQRGHRAVTPQCHICSLVAAAGSIQRLPVHTSPCLQVCGCLWHCRVSLGPQMSPGHPWLLILWETMGTVPGSAALHGLSTG